MIRLTRASTFRHGIHPGEHKEATHRLPIERMPFVEEYVIPLSQHAGKPASPVVSAGASVRRGQLIAAPEGFISSALHAPVTGSVRAIELRPHPNGQRMPAIVIAIDPFASQVVESDVSRPDESMPPDRVAELIQQAGLVGMGGAAFPSHVKLLVPEGKRVEFVILNGCECEPYLTCDHRTMAERPRQVLRGLRLIMHQVGARRGYIGIELNKPDAIEALRDVTADDEAIEIIPLEVKYPQGAEKMLIDSVFHREIPSGKLPIDVQILVQNVGTATALAALFDQGIPLIERVVTVAGSGVSRPSNLLVPVGTPLQAVLDHCGGLRPDVHEVILGGPMMGMAQTRLDVPTLKGITGILAFTGRVTLVEEQPCIRCGRCLEACPVFLNPSRLAALTRNENVPDLQMLNVTDCFECASCSYVCPSHIPLVQLIRVGKAMARKKAAS